MIVLYNTNYECHISRYLWDTVVFKGQVIFQQRMTLRLCHKWQQTIYIISRNTMTLIIKHKWTCLTWINKSTPFIPRLYSCKLNTKICSFFLLIIFRYCNSYCVSLDVCEYMSAAIYNQEGFPSFCIIIIHCLAPLSSDCVSLFLVSHLRNAVTKFWLCKCRLLHCTLLLFTKQVSSTDGL